jgi:kynurenine formamidase
MMDGGNVFDLQPAPGVPARRSVMQHSKPSVLIRLVVPGIMLVAAAGMLQAGQPSSILDMTYAFDDSSIYWPTATPFALEQVAWGPTEAGYWYASNNFSASEHGGTHADAPIHFAEGGRTIDQIPLSEWIGPAVRIDVTGQCKESRDYMLQVSDILAWEKEHGRIPKGAWVIMYTGIGTTHYPDRTKVLGTDKSGAEAVPLLSFPGFSPESAELLVKQREITGIAIDTPSIDAGSSKDFRVHQIVCGAGKLALENIANLDHLPATGATLYVIPMMIRGGTGAPARVFASFSQPDSGRQGLESP